MQAQKIIVIHPGSRNLRIGRASDLNPITMLHAVGRKRLKPASQTHQPKKHCDTLLPALQEEALADFVEHCAQITQTLQPAASGVGSAKRSRTTTPTKQIIAFNKQSVPEQLPANLETNGQAMAAGKQTIFDQDLLDLTPAEAQQYNIHFPLKRGELNLHAGIGGSLAALLADLEDIWRHAICARMRIPSGALGSHSVVLVVPDVYIRSQLRELVTLLLQRLKVRACFVLPDHVASTFGAGLGYACVVDVGDQKCSVSCVEDGISHTDTRLRLPYGGSDITRVFEILLQRRFFPYKACDVEHRMADAALLTQLKERFCNLMGQAGTVQERTFEIKQADGKRMRYTLQLGDECAVAPLALFHPELLNVTGKQRQARMQLTSSQQPDPEDCFDADYIRDTGRRNGMRGDQLLEGTMPLTGDTAEDELVVVDAYEVDSNVVGKTNEQRADFAYTSNGQLVSLDQAIIRSIERCNSEELKRKMYASILLVGGGAKLAGFVKCLEQKLQLQLMSGAGPRSTDQPPIEVNVFMKEMDSAMIAWKGSAIMSCLESSPELWINPVEWEKYGLRILREKAPFIW